MFCRSLVLPVVCLICSFASPARSDELVQKSLEQVMAILNEHDIDGQFTNVIGSPPFRFDVLTHATLPSGEVVGAYNQTAEWNGSETFNLCRANRSAILHVTLTDKVWQLTVEDGYVKRDPAAWKMVLDQYSSSPISYMKDTKERIPIVSVKPVFLSAAYVGADPSYTYESSARSVCLTGTDTSASVYIPFRTPSDQILCGYPAEAVLIFDTMQVKGKSIDVLFGIHSFVVGSQQWHLVESPAAMAAEIEKCESEFIDDHYGVAESEREYEQGLVTEERHFEASRHMHRLINKHNHSRRAASVEKELRGAVKALREELERQTSLKGKNGSHVNPEKTWELIDRTLAVLQRLDVAASMVGEERMVACQDQFLKWTVLSRIIGAMELADFYDSVVAYFLVDESMGHKVQLLIGNGLAKLGYPQHDGPKGRVMEMRQQSAALDTIFRSRWRIGGVHSLGIKLMLKLEGAPDLPSNVNRVIVETLVSTGQLQVLQESSLDRWFDEYVLDVERDSQIVALSSLTTSDAGVEYLLDVLKERELDEDGRKLISAHLEERISHVRETERYEFISDEVCQKVEEAVGSRL